MDNLEYSFSNISESESSDIDEEQIFNEYIFFKEIMGGNGDLIFNSKAKNIKIYEGNHNISIHGYIENIYFFGGLKELHIKAPIDNLTIIGGKSTIYVHDSNDTKVNKLYIKGGEHKIEIFSFVHKIETFGGDITIKCNYLKSKVDKITTFGGTRNIYLNNITNKCQKNNKGGIFNLNLTDVIKEIPKFIEDIGNLISPSTIKDDKKDELCSICMENYKKKSIGYILPCKHFFHVNCLNQWFKGKKSRFCPNCKFKVKSKLSEL